jgi:hypothetical protein
MASRADIRWTRILAEGTAIVASILLAFAIDAGWQERQERMEEQRVLSDLEEEFIAIRSVLQEHAAQTRDSLQALEAFLREFESGPSANTGEIVAAMLLEMLNPQTSDVANGTLEALLSSGRLDIVENRELRAQLAGWKSAISEVWDDQEIHSKLVFETFIPYFVAEGIPAGTLISQWQPEWSAPVTAIRDDAEVVGQILADHSMLVLAQLRYGYKLHTAEEFEIVIANVDAILRNIDASLH